MTEKTAPTQVAIDSLIAKRWSPRAYDANKSVSHEQILSLLEAGRWAPSCYGDEPWRFIVCNKMTHPQAWDKAFSCLAEANQLWVKAVPVLIIVVAHDLFGNGNPNRWGQYDTGAAAENLCLQTFSLGLISHQMGGFDPAKTVELFSIPTGFTPMSFIAIGYQASAEVLEGRYHSIELAPRQRLPMNDNCFFGQWDSTN